jgi:hypothetical protein
MKRAASKMLLSGIVVAMLGGGLVALTHHTAAQQPGHSTAAPLGPEVVLHATWGAMGATVGRFDGDEAASEGPMSFAVYPDGQLLVLDQVNYRVVRFDDTGALLGETPIPANTFQDLEIWDGGRVVLLDRLARRSLLVMTDAGTTIREIGIEGDGIPEGGGVTAMLAEDDGIWLEFDHTSRVRLLDQQLLPSVRREVRGRPFSATANLLGELDGQGDARLWLEDAATGNVLERTAVGAGHRIDRIIWLATDGAGNVHGQFHLLEDDPADPTKITFEQVLAVRYDAALHEVARFASPYVIQEVEQFREFRVMPDGTTYQMVFEHGGMSILRWRWTP